MSDDDRDPLTEGTPAHLASSGLLQEIRLEPADNGWMNDAACADRELDLFMHHHAPRGTGSLNCNRCAEAKRVCEGCPVADECLESVLIQSEFRRTQYGVRGNMTSHERRAQMDQLRRRYAPGLTISEAAELVDVTEDMVWRWCRAEEVESMKVGRYLMVDEASLVQRHEEWLQEDEE